MREEREKGTETAVIFNYAFIYTYVFTSDVAYKVSPSSLIKIVNKEWVFMLFVYS